MVDLTFLKFGSSRVRAVAFIGAASVGAIVLILDGLWALPEPPQPIAVVEPAQASVELPGATPANAASTMPQVTSIASGDDVASDFVADTFERLETAPEPAIDATAIVASQSDADAEMVGRHPATRAVRTTMIRPETAISELPQPGSADAGLSDPTEAEILSAEPQPTLVRVGDDPVNVRSAPAVSSERLTTLAVDQEVQATGRIGDWVRVVYENESTGWVFSEYLDEPDLDALEILPEPPAEPAEIVAEATDERVVGGAGANVRSGPSRNAGTLFILSGGERVSVTGSESGWIRVVDDQQRTGWVYSELLDG